MPSRRDWIKGAGIQLGALAWPSALVPSLCHAELVPSLREPRTLMGTRVDIALESPQPDRLQPALNAAYREMTRLSDMMNHYSPTSAVSAINAAAGIAPVAIEAELMQVLRMAQAVSHRSQGCFDITVASIKGWRFSNEARSMPSPEDIVRQLPLVDYRQLVLNPREQTAFLKRQGMRIDLGGIAKIYILDAGMRVLRQQGVHSAMINGGGDVLVMGSHQGQPWRIGVRDPREPSTLSGTIELNDGIVASSGDYERFFEHDGRRYHHILDPRTGYPTQGLHGVTLVAQRLEQINGLGAAIMVMGHEKGQSLVRHSPGLDAMWVRQNGQVWLSPGMSRKLL
jgi:thiamine biosynthesis lipoprotein